MDVYFLPRDNKIYSFIVRRSIVFCYSLTIVVVGLFVCAWLYFFYIPSIETLEQYQQALAQGQINQRTDNQLQEELRNLTARTIQMEDFINGYSAKLLPADIFQAHLFFVVQQAAQQGLTLNSANFEQEYDKEWYIKNGAQFEVSGTFDNLLTWFERIKSSKNMIRCNKVSMHNLDGVHYSCSTKFTFFLPKRVTKN